MSALFTVTCVVVLSQGHTKNALLAWISLYPWVRVCMCVSLSRSLCIYIYLFKIMTMVHACFLPIVRLSSRHPKNIPMSISPYPGSATGTARKYYVSNFPTTLISNCLFLGIIPSGGALKAILCSQPAGLQRGLKSRAICCVGPPATGAVLIWDWGIYQCTCNSTEIQGLNLPPPLFPGRGVFCPIVNPRKCATGFGNPHVFTPGGLL